MSPTALNGDAIVSSLGKVATDPAAVKLLAKLKVKQPPKLKAGDLDAYAESKALGVAVVFRGERFLDVKTRPYPAGALVLWSVIFYVEPDSDYARFNGSLPCGLKADFTRKQVEAALGKKPIVKKGVGDLRWDLAGRCLFVTFGTESKRMLEVAVQLPVE